MMSASRLKAGILIAAVVTLFFGPVGTDRAFCDVSKELKKLSEEREKSVGYAKIAKVTFKKQPRKLTPRTTAHPTASGCSLTRSSTGVSRDRGPTVSTSPGASR